MLVVAVGTAFASCAGGLLLLLLELFLSFFDAGVVLALAALVGLECPQQSRTSKTLCILGRECDNISDLRHNIRFGFIEQHPNCWLPLAPAPQLL